MSDTWTGGPGRCPDPTCTQRAVEAQHWRGLLSRREFEVVADLAAEAAISAARLFCPHKQCSAPLLAPDWPYQDAADPLHCPHCKGWGDCRFLPPPPPPPPSPPINTTNTHARLVFSRMYTPRLSNNTLHPVMILVSLPESESGLSGGLFQDTHLTRKHHADFNYHC